MVQVIPLLPGSCHVTTAAAAAVETITRIKTSKIWWSHDLTKTTVSHCNNNNNNNYNTTFVTQCTVNKVKLNTEINILKLSHTQKCTIPQGG